MGLINQINDFGERITKQIIQSTLFSELNRVESHRAELLWNNEQLYIFTPIIFWRTVLIDDNFF